VINLNLSTASKVGLNVLAVLGVITGLYIGRLFFIPAVIAMLLAAILWPAARGLNRRLRVPWAAACTTVVLLVVALFVLVALGFIPVVTLFEGVGDLRDAGQQQEFYNKFRDRVGRIIPVERTGDVLPEDYQRSFLFNKIKQLLQGDAFNTVLMDLLAFTSTLTYNFVLIAFILLFLLMEGEMLIRRVRGIFGPGPEVETRVVAALTEMATSVRAYLVWRTIINFALGILLGVVFWWIGMPQAWTWATLVAVLNYVPYIGPIIAGIPPVLLAFVYFPSPWAALGILAFYAAVVTFEGYVVVPVVMGRNMELNATTVMLACLFWELVWGVPGLFLAMPIMAALRAVCMHVPGWRAWGALMSTAHGGELQAMPGVGELAAKKGRDPEPDDTILMEALPPLPPPPDGSGPKR
jgi:predicted PurR-regulated permease PerM